jgi:ATP-dependent Clp protease ATP-binding subunit ClpC
MFERYTERARRVIFVARCEASEFGSPYIETEHLLLALLQEDMAMVKRFLPSDPALESIRKQIENHTTIRKRVSTSVDLPLSHECMHVLVNAAAEAQRLNHVEYIPAPTFTALTVYPGTVVRRLYRQGGAFATRWSPPATGCG